MTTDDKIKVFMPDDDSLKTLGELLSNDTSRKIIKTLIENEMYTNEISKKLDIAPNVVIHHLKKLEVLGLISVVSKPISRKTKNHNFYRFNTDIFLSIMPEKKDQSKLNSIFKDGIKFASIGIASFVSWSYLKLIESNAKEQLQAGNQERIEIPDPLAVALIIIIVGLCAELIHLKIKKKG